VITQHVFVPFNYISELLSVTILNRQPKEGSSDDAAVQIIHIRWAMTPCCLVVRCQHSGERFCRSFTLMVHT